MFNLTCSIGWNELGVIATGISSITSAIAVCVAINGNFKAKKQLKMSSNIQEQAKNVELFDKRIDILEKIKLEKAVSETVLKILFNGKITSSYMEWQEQLRNIRTAESDLTTFYRQLDEEHREDPKWNMSAKEKIQRLEMEIDFPNCPQSVSDEYKKLCEVTLPPDYPGGPPGILNYEEILKRKLDAEKVARDKQTNLIELIEEYIKTSIEKINA